MNVSRNIKVYIDGNYWNYYTGRVVFEKVEWMMPREYYKDKDEWVYNWADEWTASWKERHGNNLRYDVYRHIEHDKKMEEVMKAYGKYGKCWTTTSYEVETNEPVGVYLDKEPYFSTDEDKQAYYDYWREQECGLD